MIENIIEGIEMRFLESCSIDYNLVKDDIKNFPYDGIAKIRPPTSNDKKNKFGEVFTPINIIDNMIQKYDKWEIDWKFYSIDLCSGYGNYTVRIIRKLFNKFGNSFDVDLWLKNYHCFCEIQKESIDKIEYIFGSNVNILWGDAKNLCFLEDFPQGKLHYDQTKNRWIHI